LEGGFGRKGLGNSAQEPVGFEGGFGPKGLGNLAQALAWVALFLRASPVRAPDNAGAIPYRPHPNSDDYLLRPFSSSNPAWRVFFTVGAPKQHLMRAGRVYCNATQAKAWARFPKALRAETGSKVQPGEVIGTQARQAPRLQPGFECLMSCRSEGRSGTQHRFTRRRLALGADHPQKAGCKRRRSANRIYDAVADAVYGPAKGEADLVRFLNGDGGKGLKKSSRNQRESSREDTAIHRQCNSGDECSSR
jgi:hypothetical protein